MYVNSPFYGQQQQQITDFLTFKVDLLFHCHFPFLGKDTGVRELNNTKLFLRSSFVSVWLTLATFLKNVNIIFLGITGTSEMF